MTTSISFYRNKSPNPYQTAGGGRWGIGIYPYEQTDSDDDRDLAYASANVGMKTFFTTGNTKVEGMHALQIDSNPYGGDRAINQPMLSRLIAASYKGYGGLDGLGSDDYMLGVLDSDLFGYTGTVKWLTAEVGKYFKDPEGKGKIEINIGADQLSTYFPDVPNAEHNGELYFIAEDIVHAQSNTPPGIRAGAFELGALLLQPKHDIDLFFPNGTQWNWNGSRYDANIPIPKLKYSVSGSINNPLAEIYNYAKYRFPDVYKDQPGWEKINENMKGFDKFDYGRDITQYPFNYLGPEFSGLRANSSVIEWASDWLQDSNTISQKQRVTNQVQSA